MTEMVWVRQVQKNGLVAWRCEHGLAHPDLESARVLGIDTSHQCDGCCQRADFPGKLPAAKTNLLAKLGTEVDKFLNPLNYETDIQRAERHRKENMQHELALEEVKRTKFVKTSSNGKGGTNTRVVVNDAMSREFDWMSDGKESKDADAPRERSFLADELGLADRNQPRYQQRKKKPRKSPRDTRRRY